MTRIRTRGTRKGEEDKVPEDLRFVVKCVLEWSSGSRKRTRFHTSPDLYVPNLRFLHCPMPTLVFQTPGITKKTKDTE